MTTPGNICDDEERAQAGAARPAKRKRESAYAAEQASATPTRGHRRGDDERVGELAAEEPAAGVVVRRDDVEEVARA